MADGDRAWLDKLHALDRAAALRWLREVGEVRFLRIAAAAGIRSRGRPAVSYPRTVRRALHLYVTGQATLDEASSRAAAQAIEERDWESGGPVAFPYLRMRIRTELQAAPRSLFEQVARQASQDGYETIYERSQRRQLFGLMRSFGPHLSKESNHSDPLKHELDQRIEGVFPSRMRELGAFIEAFEDLVPGETPISQVAAMFDDMHTAMLTLSTEEN